MAYGVEAFVLRTAKRHWHKSYATNIAKSPDPSDTSFETLTESPTGGLNSSDVDMGFTDTEGCNLAKICLYAGGTSPENKEIYTLCSGYSQIAGDNLWVPSYICKLKWTIGTQAGLAGQGVTNTEFFADKVELVDGDTSIRLITDTTNNVASVTMDLEGAQWLRVQFDITGLTEPDDFNCLVGVL